MNGDIKVSIKVLEYPKIETMDILTPDQIVKLIEDNQQIKNKCCENQDYYIGKNRAIVDKRGFDKDNPDSRVVVPYARTLTQIVKGYMYKPGLITYSSEDQVYINTINEIFDFNDEPLVTAELGESQSKYGLGIEILYVDQNEENQTLPRFSSVKPEEIILIYNMAIDPKVIGAIRYYITDKAPDMNMDIYSVEVYYSDRVGTYKLTDTNGKKSIEFITEYQHFFGEVPVNVYKNNTEMHADYEPIKPLIDAYDIMTSDSINEMNRFASAYLILKDYIFSNPEDGNEKAKELEMLKTRRVLEFMGGNGGAEFLTKDIPSEFFEVVKRTLREDIEYHSHIPDFRGKNFEAKSGVALQWSLLDFENLCGDKQALFEKGLRNRIKLINNFMSIKALEASKIDINFKRNTPADYTTLINTIIQLKTSGLLSDEDLIYMMPAEWVPDPEAALERMNQQKEENMIRFDEMSMGAEGGEDGEDKNDVQDSAE